jgi:hypothetical protein
MAQLILKRASASRPSGPTSASSPMVRWSAESSKPNAAPVGSPWMRTLAFGHHEDRTHQPTREAAMAAFAKSWRRE